MNLFSINLLILEGLTPEFAESSLIEFILEELSKILFNFAISALSLT